MTFGNRPQARNMNSQREHAERYDWLAEQFKNRAFTFVSSLSVIKDYDKIGEKTRDLYRQ